MKRKTDFKPFQVGTIFNPININLSDLKPRYRTIEIKYPSRLNAMALDPSKITSNNNLKYSPGEIIFKVKLYKKIKVTINDNTGGIEVSERTSRVPLVRHAALLMKKALGFKNQLCIDVDNKNEVKHAGLGSSSGLIAAVACAINELFANPIDQPNLLRYVSQNHGEEIEKNINYLYPVQCIGGSAAAGLYKGAMIVIAGENTVISSMNIPNNYKVIIGIPSDFQKQDSQTLMSEEIKSFPKFMACGEKYGKEIAYRMLHDVFPAMKNGNLHVIGGLIYDYRYHMGSIDNCSYCYKKLPELAKNFAFLKKEKIADVLSISSVGPAFFAISKDVKTCERTFKKYGMNVITTNIENNPYEVVKKEKYIHE